MRKEGLNRYNKSESMIVSYTSKTTNPLFARCCKRDSITMNIAQQRTCGFLFFELFKLNLTGVRNSLTCYNYLIKKSKE